MPDAVPNRNLRIIPRLDIKGPNLVKGIHLEGLRVLGDPAAFARRYSAEGADELLLMDVVASLYDRNSIQEIVSKVARECAVPLTVGGGLRNIEDIRTILRAGADKVSLNTAAVRRPEFIEEAVASFGSSTIVLALEVIQQSGGRYQCYTDNGREETGLDVVDWAKEGVRRGVGEVLLTSVDREGTGRGFDLKLVQQVTEAVDVPVIVHGGAGKPSDIAALARMPSVDAVCIASLLHYFLLEHEFDVGSVSGEEGNVEYLRHRRPSPRFQTISLAELKRGLASEEGRVRPIQEVPASLPAIGNRRPRIGIVDMQIGNLFSVSRACQQTNSDSFISSDPGELQKADGVILPGVGHFGEAMRHIRSQGLDDFLKRWHAEQRPLLGVCLGLQLLFESSAEDPVTPGLGLLPGRVELLPSTALWRVPHVGWNTVAWTANAPQKLRVEGDGLWYFVHNYHAVPANSEDVAALTPFGAGQFCSAVARDACWAVQFHPEKSAGQGIDLYRQWMASFIADLSKPLV